MEENINVKSISQVFTQPPTSSMIKRISTPEHFFQIHFKYVLFLDAENTFCV